MSAISCSVAGVAPSIQAHRFDSAVKLLLAAGMPVEDLARTPSNRPADSYGVEHPPLRDHDALFVSHVLRHLLSNGKLERSAFD